MSRIYQGLYQANCQQEWSRDRWKKIIQRSDIETTVAQGFIDYSLQKLQQKYSVGQFHEALGFNLTSI
jgi:hypothetical protein